MRIALISDIHGNAIALEAVLNDLAGEPIDQFVCLGDVAEAGPQPSQVIARLRELGCLAVMGNTDAQMLLHEPYPPRDGDTPRYNEIVLWCADQLTPANLDTLRSFQATIELELGKETTLLGFHGSPRSYNDIILAVTPEDELSALLDGLNATLMAGGHTHRQLLRRHDQTLIINPGSVGLPVEHVGLNSPGYHPPWAEYAVISYEGGRLGIDLRRVPLDIEAIVQAAFNSGMPHAEWWASDWKQ